MGAAATALKLLRVLKDNGGRCDSLKLKKFPDGSWELDIVGFEVGSLSGGHDSRAVARPPSLPRRRELGWFGSAYRDGLVEEFAVWTVTRAVSLVSSWIPHLDGPLLMLWMLTFGPSG